MDTQTKQKVINLLVDGWAVSHIVLYMMWSDEPVNTKQVQDLKRYMHRKVLKRDRDA